MMDRYELKQTLQGNIATVVFEKADGTLREMRCTLQADYLPPQLLQEGASARGEFKRSLCMGY
jgi:hypothetical protein